MIDGPGTGPNPLSYAPRIIPVAVWIAIAAVLAGRFRRQR